MIKVQIKTLGPPPSYVMWSSTMVENVWAAVVEHHIVEKLKTEPNLKVIDARPIF